MVAAVSCAWPFRVEGHAAVDGVFSPLMKWAAALTHDAHRAPSRVSVEKNVYP